MKRKYLLLNVIYWLISIFQFNDSLAKVIYDIVNYNELYEENTISSQDTIHFFMNGNNFLSSTPFAFDLSELNLKDRKWMKETGEKFVTFGFKFTEYYFDKQKAGIRIDAAPIFLINSVQVRVELEIGYFLFAFFKKKTN